MCVGIGVGMKFECAGVMSLSNLFNKYRQKIHFPSACLVFLDIIV